MAAPEANAATAALITRYRSLNTELQRVDRECLALASDNDWEQYREACARRTQVRSATRAASDQLCSLLGIDEWRRLETETNPMRRLIALATINPDSQREENDTMKNTTKAAATTTTATTTTTKAASKKGATKKGASKETLETAAAAPVNETTVELDPEFAAATAPTKGATKGKAARATRTAAAKAVQDTREASAQLRDAANVTAPAAADAAPESSQPARAARSADAGGQSRTDKLAQAAVAIYNRLNAATPEQPVTRGDLNSNADRNIARGLAAMGLVVRLEDGKGRNIRYHKLAKPGKGDPIAAIQDAAKTNPAQFQ